MTDADTEPIPTPIERDFPPAEAFREWLASDVAQLVDSGQYDAMPPVVDPDTGGLSQRWRQAILGTAEIAAETADHTNSVRGTVSAEETDELKSEVQSLYGRNVSWAVLTSVAIKHHQRSKNNESKDFPLTLEIRLRDFEDTVRACGHQATSSSLHNKYLGQGLDVIDQTLQDGDLAAANNAGKQLIVLAAQKLHSMSQWRDLPEIGLTD